MSKPFGKSYELQVRLLLEVLPIISRYPQFALKGGTAINLFVRNFPRLSVDIDLAYLPIASRSESVADSIHAIFLTFISFSKTKELQRGFDRHSLCIL